METIPIVILLSVALVLPAQAAVATIEPPTQDPASTVLSAFSYPTDPEALKREFRETGAVRLHVPVLGEIVVKGSEVNIWAERRWFIAGSNRDDILASGIIDDIPMVGTVMGDPTSMARPYLGLYGVYGRVVTQGLTFDFDPRLEEGKFIQDVIVRDLDMPQDDPWFRPLDRIGIAGLTTSYVIYDVELEYQNTHGDWYSRASSAFSNLYPMWTNANIDLKLSGPWGWNENWILTTNSGTAINNYANWLTNHLSTLANAYQTITARDLDGSSTYGRSWGDTARIGVTNNRYASSVVEMTNFWGDLYDANSAYERGIVSGHEFTHIFGEEDEETGCNWYPTDCNIMQPYIDNSGRRFYWKGNTICEIQSRFYNGQEC